MRYGKLQNYLREKRLKSALSQDEVAELLGLEAGTNVSRHECFKRTPTLHRALAYALIFRTTVEELFAGEVEQVRECLKDRARTLVGRLEESKRTDAVARKIAALVALIDDLPLDL